MSRFYAAGDEKGSQGSLAGALVNFIYAFIPTILGIITLALINRGKFSSAQFESVGARYAPPVVLPSTPRPALICGLLFAGIISATMSSPDSDLLAQAPSLPMTSIKAVKPDASSQSVMKVTKIVMCLVAWPPCSSALYTQSIVSILMFCFT